jgi:hypothetical protein
MNYFTSIKNNYYFSWQIELLIESFKKHNIEDQLFISLDNNEILDNCKNLKNHKNIIVGNDYGGELNKPCRLLEAIESNLVEFPVALIHPDMVLKRPLNKFADDIICSVSIDEDDDELLVIKKEVSNDDSYSFLPIGNITVFNNSNTLGFLKSLIEYYNFSSELPNIEKIALLKTLYVYYDQLSIKLEPMEVAPLHNNFESNFIHYKYGVPPAFMKHKFEETNPYELLKTFDSTDNLKYISQIIEKLVF